jgi:hypothetical protein
MFSKISILEIIKDHIKTLKSDETKRIHCPDIFIFFVIPGILSSAMLALGVFLNDGFVNALITSFSIFSALLFNLLLLVYGISDKPRNESSSDVLERKAAIKRRIILREIYVNVSFSILISAIAIVLLLTYFLKIRSCEIWMIDICSLKWLLVFIIYYLSAQFLLTLVMILKRIYKLLSKAFDPNI